MVFSLYSVLGIGVSVHILALESVATVLLIWLLSVAVCMVLSILLDPKKVQILVIESFAAVMASTEGRKSMLKLAERMAMRFYGGVKHPMTQRQIGVGTVLCLLDLVSHSIL